MKKMKKIKTIEQLEKLASRESGADCFIWLGGILRSSKFVSFKSGLFYIFHSIDGHDEEITRKKLSKSNIGKAIEEGTLYIG